MTEASTDITTQQAVSPQAEQTFRTDFEFTREIPENLKALDTISRNFYWSWQPEGVAFFRDLDPALWDRCEQNPRVFLKKVSGLRLWQRSADNDYVERLQRFNEQFKQYLSATNNEQLTTND